MIAFYAALLGAAVYAGCYGVHAARKKRVLAAVGAFLLPSLLLAMILLLLSVRPGA